MNNETESKTQRSDVMSYSFDRSGWSKSHTWVILEETRRWYVIGMGDFARSAFAVIDDFGNLVEVPQ